MEAGRRDGRRWYGGHSVNAPTGGGDLYKGAEGKLGWRRGHDPALWVRGILAPS